MVRSCSLFSSDVVLVGFVDPAMFCFTFAPCEPHNTLVYAPQVLLEFSCLLAELILCGSIAGCRRCSYLRQLFDRCGINAPDSTDGTLYRCVPVWCTTNDPAVNKSALSSGFALTIRVVWMML